jgi:hypothetical protein
MIPQGGTFVRPGVLAWDGPYSRARLAAQDRAGPPLPGSPGPAPRQAALGEPSCEGIEQAIASATASAAIRGVAGIEDLLDELASARLWVPLPDGPGPVTDGSAVSLPVIMSLEGELVPAFTSVQRLGTWADPRRRRGSPARASGPVRSGDPGWLQRGPGADVVFRHVVVPFTGLARLLPPGLGIVINPGAGISVSIYADALAVLRAMPLSRVSRRRETDPGHSSPGATSFQAS